MLLVDATDSVVQWVDVGAVWFDDMNLCVYLLQKPESDAGSVCDSTILLKDEQLSWQLTSGTRICELVVCRSKEIISSKFCDSVNNWLNIWEIITKRRKTAQFVSSSNVCISQGSVGTHLKCDGHFCTFCCKCSSLSSNKRILNIDFKTFSKVKTKWDILWDTEYDITMTIMRVILYTETLDNYRIRIAFKNVNGVLWSLKTICFLSFQETLSLSYSVNVCQAWLICYTRHTYQITCSSSQYCW